MSKRRQTTRSVARAPSAPCVSSMTFFLQFLKKTLSKGEKKNCTDVPEVNVYSLAGCALFFDCMWQWDDWLLLHSGEEERQIFCLMFNSIARSRLAQRWQLYVHSRGKHFTWSHTTNTHTHRCHPSLRSPSSTSSRFFIYLRQTAARMTPWKQQSFTLQLELFRFSPVGLCVVNKRTGSEGGEEVGKRKKHLNIPFLGPQFT